MSPSPPITHRSVGEFLEKWHEKESWGNIARRLLGIKIGQPPKGKEQAREIRRIAALLSAQANGNTRSAEVMKLLGYQPRCTPYYTLAFRFKSKDEFEKARSAVDSHPSGRTRWIKEKLQ